MPRASTSWTSPRFAYGGWMRRKKSAKRGSARIPAAAGRTRRYGSSGCRWAWLRSSQSSASARWPSGYSAVATLGSQMCVDAACAVRLSTTARACAVSPARTNRRARAARGRAVAPAWSIARSIECSAATSSRSFPAAATARNALSSPSNPSPARCDTARVQHPGCRQGSALRPDPSSRAPKAGRRQGSSSAGGSPNARCKWNALVGSSPRFVRLHPPAPRGSRAGPARCTSRSRGPCPAR